MTTRTKITVGMQVVSKSSGMSGVVTRCSDDVVQGRFVGGGAFKMVKATFVQAFDKVGRKRKGKA